MREMEKSKGQMGNESTMCNGRDGGSREREQGCAWRMFSQQTFLYRPCERAGEQGDMHEMTQEQEIGIHNSNKL